MNKDQVRRQMDEALAVLKTDLSSMRTGRSTPGLVENIQITAYGGAQRLKIMELASINAPDSESLTIDPWDKSVIGEIHKGILAANLGLNPSIDGEIIRISLPPMTGEDREKHVKLLNTKLESARIMIRRVRGEAMKSIKKGLEEKQIGEDEKHRFERELQDTTDEFVKKIDELGTSKENELLQV